MASGSQLPPIPGQLPQTQGEWQQVANALQSWRRILQGPTWHAAALLNGWTNYGGGWAAAGYLMDGAGRLWLRGLVTAGAVGSTIFTLPTRPPYLQLFSTVAEMGGSEPILARVDVDTSGNVAFRETSGSGTVGWLSLNGLSFDLRV